MDCCYRSADCDCTRYNRKYPLLFGLFEEILCKNKLRLLFENAQYYRHSDSGSLLFLVLGKRLRNKCKKLFAGKLQTDMVCLLYFTNNIGMDRSAGQFRSYGQHSGPNKIQSFEKEIDHAYPCWSHNIHTNEHVLTFALLLPVF